MSEHVEIPARPIAILDTQAVIDELENEVTRVFREDWPDWIFTRAIDTRLKGPNGELYVRLDPMTRTALGLNDEQSEESGKGPKRRGPPAKARIPETVRDNVIAKMQELPKEWGDELE